MLIKFLYLNFFTLLIIFFSDNKSISDQEYSYNEYDVIEGSSGEGSKEDMENYQALGESLNALSPIRNNLGDSHDYQQPNSNGFQRRNNSMRKFVVNIEILSEQ